MVSIRADRQGRADSNRTQYAYYIQPGPAAPPPGSGEHHGGDTFDRFGARRRLNPGGEMTAATLAGRTVLVIGASAGIGRSFATRAVQSGAEVVVVARRADRLEALVTEAGTCTTLAVDISRP